MLNVNKLLGITLFLMCVFPYLSLVNTSFDTQPYAVTFSVLSLILIFYVRRDLEIPTLILPFGIVFVYSIIILLVNSDLLLGFRSLVGYASVLFISLASFYTFKSVKGKHFSRVVWVWLIFGLIQMFISKGFGSQILSRLSTSETRGITSLAVEPSFYSIICIFFLIFNDIFFAQGHYSKKKRTTLLFLIVLQLLLARSGLGFVLFFVYLFAKMVSQNNLLKNLKYMIGTSVAAGFFITLFSFVPSLQITRAGQLLYKAFHNPMSLFLADASIADRSVHIIASHLSLIYSNGLGFGLSNWRFFAEDIVSEAGGFTLQLASVNMTHGGRIMSGWGTAIFELGFMGVVFLLAFTYLMLKGAKRVTGEMRKVYLSSLITIYFIMINAVSIAFPLFGYMVGAFVALQYKNDVIKEGNSVQISNYKKIS